MMGTAEKARAFILVFARPLLRRNSPESFVETVSQPLRASYLKMIAVMSGNSTCDEGHALCMVSSGVIVGRECEQERGRAVLPRRLLLKDELQHLFLKQVVILLIDETRRSNNKEFRVALEAFQRFRRKWTVTATSVCRRCESLRVVNGFYEAHRAAVEEIR